MEEQHKNLIDKIKEEQDKEFYDLFDKRFLEIARLADKGDDIGYGIGLSRLQIDINKWHISSLQQVMEVVKNYLLENMSSDHSNCTIKETCIGYQNAISDIINLLSEDDK